MDYARYVAASLFYLSIKNQRDPAGLIVFDDKVRELQFGLRRGQGQLYRLMAGLEQAEPAGADGFCEAVEALSGVLKAARDGAW